jgi:hypothetical protein
VRGGRTCSRWSRTQTRCSSCTGCGLRDVTEGRGTLDAARRPPSAPLRAREPLRPDLTDAGRTACSARPLHPCIHAASQGVVTGWERLHEGSQGVPRPRHHVPPPTAGVGRGASLSNPTRRAVPKACVRGEGSR